MNELPVSLRPVLRRLARRLAIGLFLDVWPAWAVGSLLVAGLAALICRLFVPDAAPHLRWLWLAPLLMVVPALIVCFRGAYRPEEVVVLADSLAGGQGLLLTLAECDDPVWAGSPMVEDASSVALPRLRPWRSLALVPPAAAFLAAVLWLPQRMPSPSHAVLADEIAGDLTATLTELKQQELVTPEEEKKLEEEIERLRHAADERVDASSWEAADALRERVVASLSEKQEAAKWAEESLRRFSAATEGGAGGTSDAQAETAELAEAIGKLAKSGLLAGAPADLRQLVAGGKLPTDAQSLRHLTASLSKYLAETSGRFGDLARLGKEFGRFDPSEFPLDSGSSPDGDGDPGNGGINRGRADADLTWGEESLPLDRFRAEALPPGAARSPDDWAPLVELPGAPNEAPVLSTPAAARQYAQSAGQTAWRRTLAPRHQSAVKKYFAEQKRLRPERGAGG
jgi:hypothetical protein